MKIKKISLFLLILTVGLASVGGIALAVDVPSSAAHIFLPVLLHRILPPELLDAWVMDQTGIRSETYAPSESVHYHIEGQNPANRMKEVFYRWTQAGPCGEIQVYEDTLILPSGSWVYDHQGAIPDCLGTHTNTVLMAFEGYTSTVSTIFEVVDTSSQITTSDAHGFDKCGLPSIEQMDTWRQASPYQVFNIYLGGDHFACNLLIDADWVRKTAIGGWDFILTWAGHGTSCWEGNRPDDHPISSDPDEARKEGWAAAQEAIAAARDLGFLGQKIIYYDVEGYSDIDPDCRPAMAAFLEGWAARLHESGDKAGAYGSPCRSYIMDWANNDPPLDGIWFARWSYDEFNPSATVWESPDASCALPDGVWEFQQRIRQYTPAHSEAWGQCYGDDCTINSIGSNVLYGEITKLIVGDNP